MGGLLSVGGPLGFCKGSMRDFQKSVSNQIMVVAFLSEHLVQGSLEPEKSSIAILSASKLVL